MIKEGSHGSPGETHYDVGKHCVVSQRVYDTLRKDFISVERNTMMIVLTVLLGGITVVEICAKATLSPEHFRARFQV